MIKTNYNCIEGPKTKLSDLSLEILIHATDNFLLNNYYVWGKTDHVDRAVLLSYRSEENSIPDPGLCLEMIMLTVSCFTFPEVICVILLPEDPKELGLQT